MTINPLDIRTYAVDLAAGAGSTEVVAAVTGQRWVVISTLLCTAAANSTLIVLSAATAITGTIPIPVNTIIDLGDGASALWVSRASGEALNMDPGAGEIDGYVNVVWMK